MIKRVLFLGLGGICLAQSVLAVQDMRALPDPPPAVGFLPEQMDVAVDLKQSQNPKLSGPLNYLLLQDSDRLPAGSMPTSLVNVSDGQVDVVVSVSGELDVEQVRAQIQHSGGTVSRVYRTLLFAKVPVSSLESLAASNRVIKIRTPAHAHPTAVTSEGVAMHRANEMHNLGFTGKGVKIGVLDCGGFSGYQALQGSELPAQITVWQGGLSGNPIGTGNHGTACAEIIHDMAPDAQLFFAHDASEADYIAALDWFAQNDVDIVSYSCGWMGEFPNDGEGLPYNVINQKASDLRRLDDVLVVASAGNSGLWSNYQAYFTPSNADPTLHKFDDTWDFAGLVFLGSGPHYFTLSWDDWPVDPTQSGSTQDYDFFLMDLSGTLVNLSTNYQSGAVGETPFEEMGVWVPPGAEGFYYLVIMRYAATKPAYFNLRYSGYGGMLVYNASSSIRVPAESPDVVAAGAVFWNDGQLEPFSSQGPTLGKGGTATGGYPKPDVVGADGVSTVTYGPSDGNTWLNSGTGFFGTSAAAPHVAGAAALIKSMSPGDDANTLEEKLLGTAKDLADPGMDNQTGMGLVDLGAALRAFYSPRAVPALSVWGLLLSLFSVTLLSGIVMRRRSRKR